MISIADGLLALAVLVMILVLLRDRPRFLCGAALAGFALPFFLPTPRRFFAPSP